MAKTVRASKQYWYGPNPSQSWFTIASAVKIDATKICHKCGNCATIVRRSTPSRGAESGTRERVPLQWAITQNNLGGRFEPRRAREGHGNAYEEAVDACREALKERTRERVPLDWAATQNNLGSSLSPSASERGTRKHSRRRSTLREALQERTRERVPLDWAMTQNNLGTALKTLGEREGGTETLAKAVNAYREALTVFESRGVALLLAGDTTKSQPGHGPA